MNVLGINDGHNASVSLIENGKIITVLEEERFTRQKGDTGFPKNCLNYLFKFYPTHMSSIEYVGLASFDTSYYLLATKKYPKFKVKDFLIEEERVWEPMYNQGININIHEVMKEYIDEQQSHYQLNQIKDKFDLKELRLFRKKYISNYLKLSLDRIIIVDHHTCHGYHAYYSSPIDKNCIIFTIDGFGDGCNAKVFKIENKKLICLYQTDLFNIGRIYRYITLLLGMKPAEHEFKVMGLAPYAKDFQVLEIIKIFEDTYYVDGLDIKINKKIKNHYHYFKNKLAGYRFDAIAGALQKYTENIISLWVKNWVNETGLNNIRFSGGVSLNIKVSKIIYEMKEVKNIFVPIGGGDENLSIGAAQYIFCKYSDSSKLKSIDSPYLSASFVEEDIHEVISSKIVKKNFIVKENFNFDEIGKLLSTENIIAVINENMEFGPRALGHRSILADPRNIKMIDKINTSIKDRDFWMPFTPSILEEDFNKYVLNPKNLKSPFMTLAFDSTELAKKQIPAALHPYDGTIRPQEVNKKINSNLYKIINSFKKFTGVGALLNTSLNIHSKPIVHKPIDLFKEVISNKDVKLDTIVINNKYLITKKT